MFKNCARAENEICLCQFGLYTGKSHILRTPGYQQQVHPARGRATGEQHCRGWCSGNETAESLGWTQKIHAWGGLQNEIQSTRIFVKSRKLSFPQKLPLETTFHPWNSAAYTCFFFLAGAVLMAPLTPRADTFPSTENTKEAEILSITWR